MSDFGAKAVELLALVDHINYGQVQLTPKYETVEFWVWYAGNAHEEEESANALIGVLFGTVFDVERATSIGHTTFIGTWSGLRVTVRTGPGAFCEKVKTGERVVPAQEALPERVEDVYEWRCADPIRAVAS